MSTDSQDVVDCKNVWKIFGDRADEAKAAVRAKNLSKAEVLDHFGCVVGVRDVPISVGEREIFCIMGLPGSGKPTLVRHINRLIEPTAGEILINGTNVGDLNAEALREMRAANMDIVNEWIKWAEETEPSVGGICHQQRRPFHNTWYVERESSCFAHLSRSVSGRGFG